MDDIIAVTPPDDTGQDGKRLLLIDLSKSQMYVLSQAFNELKSFDRIITYFWNDQDPIEWLIDKKSKSDLIIFNADGLDQQIVGYIAAQPRSYYFGTLKNLYLVNNHVIYDYKQAVEILEKVLN
jgi:hypothetical protein